MGFRTQEEEDALSRMTMDEFLLGKSRAAFLVRASSDALRGDGILRGDLVLVDRSLDPRLGDIVLAVEDEAFVLRRFQDAIDAALKVEAVVTAAIRKFR
jgi:SOS-response transcriptional repressors (RecA-mediated autopeptidases)